MLDELHVSLSLHELMDLWLSNGVLITSDMQLIMKFKYSPVRCALILKLMDHQSLKEFGSRHLALAISTINRNAI